MAVAADTQAVLEALRETKTPSLAAKLVSPARADLAERRFLKTRQA